MKKISRRNFIYNAAAAGAGIMASGALSSFSLPAGMKSGLVTYHRARLGLTALISNCENRLTGVELRTQHAHKVKAIHPATAP